MPHRSHFLSVVIPCYNEEARIESTIQQTAAYLVATNRNFEILIVDDGSSDDTRSLVEELAARHSWLSVHGYATNQGKGEAVRHGIFRSRGDIVLFMDADLATPIEEIEKLESAIESCDIAFGSRALSLSRLEIRQPRYRELMGRTFNLMVQLLAVPGIYDTQCGFKLIRQQCARHLFPMLTAKSYTFDVELLFLARRCGYRVAEVPIRWRHIPLSRVNPIIDSSRMAFDLIKMRINHLIRP